MSGAFDVGTVTDSGVAEQVAAILVLDTIKQIERPDLCAQEPRIVGALLGTITEEQVGRALERLERRPLALIEGQDDPRTGVNEFWITEQGQHEVARIHAGKSRCFSPIAVETFRHGRSTGGGKVVHGGVGDRHLGEALVG